MQYAALERLTNKVGKEYDKHVCLGISHWSEKRNDFSIFVYIPYDSIQEVDHPYFSTKSESEMLSFLRWLLQGVKK